MSMSVKIFAYGDNVVDCYRDKRLMYPGGNAVNLAVFARRAGAETLYAGAVGDDRAGELLRTALVKEGVDVSAMRLGSEQTAYCLIETRDGERIFLGAHPGCSIIRPSESDLERMAECHAVHTGRSSFIDHWLPRLSQLTRVSYDLATVRDTSHIAAVAPYCFLLTFSGSGLTLEEARQLAYFALGQGAQWCLVTRGNESALLTTTHDIYEVMPKSIDPVDTIGAGDTFVAYVLVGLLKNESTPPAILADAADAAARTCTLNGAFGHAAPLEIDASGMLTMEAFYQAAETTANALAADL